MAIDRTGAGADAPSGPQRSGGWPATVFLPREECRRRSREAGEESRELAVAVQAHEAKPYPVQIGPSQDETKTAGQNRTERRRREHLTRPTPQRGRQPRHQPRRGPTLSHFCPAERTNTRAAAGLRDRRSGRGFRPGQVGARRTARGSVPFSVKPSTASTRHIRDGRVEVICTGPTNMAGPSTPRRLASRRGALTRADGENASAAMGPNRRDHEDVPARAGRARVDHRRWASLRRLMMSAFGPPPAPLRFVGWTTRSGQSRDPRRMSRRP